MAMRLYPDPDAAGRDYIEFPLGWDNVNTLAKIPLGAMQKCDNMEYRDSVLARRRPFVAKSSVDFTTPGVFQGRQEYIDSAGTSRILHAHNNGTIKEFVSAESSVDRVTGLTAEKKVRFASMNNACFAVNGSESLRRADGTTWRIGGAPIPPTSLVLSAGSGTNMAAGDYYFIVVSVVESAGTAILKSDWLGPTKITLGAIGAVKVDWTATTDTRATHYYIYRTLANVGSPFYYDGKVAVGTETYNANTADASMSETLADNQNRNGQAPIGSIVTESGERLVIANLSTGSNQFHVSVIATNNYEMEYFPSDGIHLISAPGKGPITAVIGLGIKDEASNRRDLFISQRESCYILRGTDPNTELETISGNMGALNPDAVIQWGRFLFIVSMRGLEFYGPAGEPQIISDKVQNFFEGGGPLSLGGINGEQYIYLHVWENKLLITNRDDTSKTWGNKTLVMDLEAFNPYDPDPANTARFTVWDGPGMAFYLPLQNRELVLFDNQNLKMLKRGSSTDTQDLIGSTATNITALIWSGALMAEILMTRKTPCRCNVYHISDSDTTFRLEADYGNQWFQATLPQIINYMDWDKVWDKRWSRGDSWQSTLSLTCGTRPFVGRLFQMKLTINHSDYDYMFIGLTVFFKSQKAITLGTI